MNKKRQTVWLVSMLSIMVVLSAYYLFTDDGGDVDQAANGDANSIVVDLLNDEGMLEWTDDMTTALEDANPTGDKAAEETALTDEDILERVDAWEVSGMNEFLTMEMLQEDEFARELEEWNAIINDAEKSEAEIAEAMEKISELQMQQDAIDEIEGQLKSQYANAVVLRQNDAWKVVVQAEKLEKSEALSIIELVMDKLGAHPSDIRVELKV